MSIGKQIKQRRLELNMSQEDLANKIGISRSAVSNWEIERNYPDLQIIVSLSEILDISLDTLLKDDQNIVKKISNDTNERKSLDTKIKFLYIGIAILLIFLLFFMYSNRYQDLKIASQIESMNYQNNTISIETKLPIYQSLSGYYMGNSPEDNQAIELTLTTKLDLSFKNVNSMQIPFSNNGNFDKIIVIGNNKKILTYNLYS